MTTRMAVVALALAACGGKQQVEDRADVELKCDSRRASYDAVGTLMYQSMGVRIYCEGNQPIVEQYFVTDEGQEQTNKGTVRVGTWEEAWSAFQNAGWRNLKDCENPNAGEREPLYTFEVGDSEYQVTFSCQGNSLPFPHDTLQRALDTAAGELPATGAEPIE